MTENLSERKMRERVIKLVFGADKSNFERFCDVLRESLPSGERWNDGAPFDAEVVQAMLT